MKTNYDITMDRNREGVLVCHVMRPPICLYTLEGRPEGEKYRLVTIVSPTERIYHGVVDNETTARLNLARMAQQYAMSHVVTRAGGRR